MGYEIKTHYEGRTSKAVICLFDSLDLAKEWLELHRKKLPGTSLHIRRVTTTTLTEDIHE